MLVILLIALGLLTWLIIWLKRRHRKKTDKKVARASGLDYDPEKRSAKDPRRSATPDLWGPHQMMHATQGFGYATGGIEEPIVEKDKKRNTLSRSSRDPEKGRMGIAEIDKHLSKNRPATQRARPSDLELNARMIGAADRHSKSRGKSRAGPSSSVEKEIGIRETPSQPDR